jgi:autotransporter translocation and assembly factor TamB
VAATGTLVTAQPLKTPLFSSSGPLRVAFRAGGDVAGLGGKQPSLSLSGKADSLNLQPSQVTASFKASGALFDPELRLQLKGPIEGQPVKLSATGRYRKGWSPVTASLTWQQTKIDYSGKVDPVAKKVDGRLTAAAVDLARFSGDPALAGVASLEASLSGAFDKLNVAGKLTAPRISYTTPQKRYDVEQLSAGFKLVDGNRISVSDGKLIFEGNSLHAEGTLGKAGSDLQSPAITSTCSRPWRWSRQRRRAPTARSPRPARLRSA